MSHQENRFSRYAQRRFSGFPLRKQIAHPVRQAIRILSGALGSPSRRALSVNVLKGHLLNAGRNAHVLAFLACVFGAVPSWAQRSYAPPFSVERDRQTFVVNADGTYSQKMEHARRIRTPKGAEDNGSLEIGYISSQEDILSVEAWTVTAEGARVSVMPSAIRDREEDNRGGVADYSDSKVKAIIYPRVEVGGLIAYEALSRVHTVPYPGEFSRSFVLSPSFAFREWEASFVLPESRKLYVDKRGISGGLVKTVDGLSYYSFRYQRDKVLPPQSEAAGLIHYADYLFVSTMPDMRALGRVAKTFFEPNVEVSGEIRALAQQLTVDSVGDRSKVKALYNWVTQNIRYVSVALGDGRLVPRPASLVLHNRYGDCKDHVVLLESLLSAVGIASSPAMINSGASHLFSAIGSHYPINHVITYVPSLDLYLDSTDPFAPFGTLPVADVDKPVVLTALDRIGNTPKMKADENVSRTEVRMNIRPDGTIAGTSFSRMTGSFENSSRSSRFSKQSRPEDAEVKELLFRFNETGKGSMQFTEPTDITKPFWVRSTFTLEPLANMPGRGGMPVPVGLAPGQIAWAGSNTPEPESRFPSRCGSRVVEERYVLNFPDTISIEEIPKGMQFRQGDVRYESRFVQDGRKVTVHRTLRVQRASNVCGAKENRDWLAFYKVLQRDLRSQIIYR